MHCHACGAAVSGDPEMCPHCGAVLDTGGGRERASARQPATTSARASGGVGLEERLRSLPVLQGIVGGVVTAIVLYLVGVVLGIALPDGTVLGRISSVDFAPLAVADLHFVLPGHVTPLIFERFQTARPQPASLGILYLLPPLLLFAAGKVVVWSHEDPLTLPDSALAGAALAVGYLPLMVVIALLAPGPDPVRPDLVLVVGLAGIVYPVLFGALGGLSATVYSVAERRAGIAYGAGAFFLTLLGTFLASFLVLPQLGDADLVVRVIVSIATMLGAHAFSLGGSPAGVLPYLLAGVVVLAAGFLRVWLGGPTDSPVAGFAKGLTIATTYLLLLAVLANLVAILATNYIIEDLQIGFVGAQLLETTVVDRLRTVGEYVNLVLIGTIAYPLVLGGAGGAVAAWWEDRQSSRGRPGR